MRLLIAVCVCLSCCVSSAWARADAPSDPMATLMVILRDHAHGAPRTDRRLRHRAQFQQRATQTEAALPGRLPQPLRSAAQFEALPALNAWLIWLPQTALTLPIALQASGIERPWLRLPHAVTVTDTLVAHAGPQTRRGRPILARALD